MTMLNQATRTVPWTHWLLRAAVTIEAVLAIAQPIFIGTFLQGHYDALASHQANATIVAVAAFAMVVAAGLHWRLGRGPVRVVVACVVNLAAIVVQVASGYARALAIHIPLGVLIVAASMLLLVWAWRPARDGVDR
jgi:hypothetical protein